MQIRKINRINRNHYKRGLKNASPHYNKGSAWERDYDVLGPVAEREDRDAQDYLSEAQQAVC